jgi:hypothetical protein
MLSPREIKAKRILAGLRVKDLANEASKSLGHPVTEELICQILSRRVSGYRPRTHAVQEFVAKRLKIPVKELKPPFESGQLGKK